MAKTSDAQEPQDGLPEAAQADPSAKGRTAGSGQEAAGEAAPFAFVADEDLIVFDPEAGAMPAVAWAAGSLVPPSDIQRHPEWAGLVHAAEE